MRIFALKNPRDQFLAALGVATAVSLGLFIYGTYQNNQLLYGYLPWNLFLAWLPLFFSFWLVRILRKKLWSSWEALAASALWLAFLPNSFYMISDFIHLAEVQSSDLLYNVVMFVSFIYIGIILGFSSLYIVHIQFLKRFSRRTASELVGLILFACSLAIYLGRDLRWNTWDLFVNPFGLLFDISDRFIHPTNYPQMYLTIIAFLLLLSSMYFVAWKLVNLLRQWPQG